MDTENEGQAARLRAFDTASHALDAVKIGVLECALGEQDERAARTPIDAGSQKPYC